MMPPLQTLRSIRRPGGGLYWQIDCFDLLHDTLATSGGLLPSPDAAMDLLAAVAHPRTEWNTGDLTAGTQWSALFDLTEPSAIVRIFQNERSEFHGMKLHNFIQCSFEISMSSSFAT